MVTGMLTPDVLGTATEPKAIVDDPTLRLNATLSPL